MLRFTVEDTGVGIPASTQESIFEPFRQAHRPDDPLIGILGGTGLGLTIAKKLVNKIGGEISLTSQTEGERRGTIVRFTVPYVPATSNPRGYVTHGEVVSEQSPSATRLQGRVLLVDDNRINLKLTKRIVEKLGLECVTAENGRIAVDMYLEDKGIDVILMDKEMPVLNGLEAVREIRDEEAKSATKRVPIIALTAAAMKADQDACLSAGCDEYLPKPVDQKKLAQLLAKYTVE